MSCLICRQGDTQPGRATVTLTRDALTLVVRGVPAQVWENCGEEYVDEAVVGELLGIADDAARAGVQVDVRDYVAA